MRGMTAPLHMPWADQADRSLLVVLAFCGAFASAAVGAVLAASWFWLPLAIVAAAAVGIVAFRHTIAFCVAWLLLAGATLEMTLADLVGPAAFETTIAVVKSAELGLALLCVVRYGFRLDVFNPAFGFVAMFAAGLVFGLYPGLTPADSLRSLLGSIAPFAFAFSRYRLGGQRYGQTTVWVPLLSVAGGAALDLAGLRLCSSTSGGERLAGLGHPAFLAGFCLAAIYACLMELYRDGRSRWLILLAVNFLILVLTGARAPLAYAVAVTCLTLVFLRSGAFPRTLRILADTGRCMHVPLLAVVAHDLPSVRLFNVLTSEPGDFSGRDLLWPPFEQAAAASPWFGWGVGAGNAIIPPDSELALSFRAGRRTTSTCGCRSRAGRLAAVC